MGNKIDSTIEVLRQFRKYEDELYLYLKEDYSTQNSEKLKFYLIPKKYVDALTEIFKYKNNIKGLDELNIYLDCQENLKENEIIIRDLINIFKDKNNIIFDNKIELKKVKNKEMFDKENNNCFKLNEEGAFIPLTSNIWKAICKYYKNDIELFREGFINKGELSIITENNRVDTFFVEKETGDFIYHFCLIMNNIYDSEKVISFLKSNSIKFLLDKLDIKYVGIDIKKYKFSKIIKKIPLEIKEIGNINIEIYFIDFYSFHEENIYFIPKKKVVTQNNITTNKISKAVYNDKKNYNNSQEINRKSQKMIKNNININPSIVEEDNTNIRKMKDMMNIKNINIINSAQIDMPKIYSNYNNIRSKSNNYKFKNNNCFGDNYNKFIYNNNNFNNFKYNNNNFNSNINNLNHNYDNENNVNFQNFIMKNTLLEINKAQSNKLVNIVPNSILSTSSSSQKIEANKAIFPKSEKTINKYEISPIVSNAFFSYIDVFIQCFINVKRIKCYLANLSKEKINQNKTSLLSLIYFLHEGMTLKDIKKIKYCLNAICNYLKVYISANSRFKDVVLLILNLLYKGNQEEAEKEIKNDKYKNKSEAYKNSISEITQGTEISKYYIGLQKKTYLCTKCQTKNYKYKIFNILSVDVDKLFSENDNSLLNDSIFHFDFRKYLIKENSNREKNSKYSCQNCSHKKFIKATYIKNFPELLLISFEKDPEFIQQYSFSIDLITDLIMNKYTENQNPESNYNYYLSSFIVYDSAQKEYITYLNYKRKIWIKMDKKERKKIKVEEMEKIDNPQILLYERY